MYREDSTFNTVLSWLIAQKIRVTFETNGTLSPDFERYPFYAEAVYALSVKLSNSGEPENKRINPEALKQIVASAKEYYLKFTLSKESVEGSAFEEISRLLTILPDTDVYCMPVGESRQTIWHHDEAVFRFCMTHNFLYSDRLHIRVFDTTQGV